jgi:rod shape-determining protein MreC
MIGLVLFIALIGFTMGRNRLTWAEKFLHDTFGAVQGVLYQPVGAVAQFVRDMGRLSEVYRENEVLRQTVARYAQDQMRYNFIELENERLKKALEFTERQKRLYRYRYLIAQVIGYSSDPYNRSFRIDLGARDGVREKMAVQTVDGLVGIISRVSEFTSTVMPLTELDPNSPTAIAVSATALGRESETFGVVDAYDRETGLFRMSRIDPDDPLQEGDIIITSGLGALFPRGIVIGTVVEKQVGDFGLTLTADIRPASAFDHLTEVFVVVVPDMDRSEAETP